MKRGKIILWVSVIIALAIAALIYFNWNPEHLLRMNEKTVFLADIEQNGREAYIGSLAGADIPRINGKEEFQTTPEPAFTAEPVDVVYTGAYELKSWVDPYIYRRTRKGRKYGAPKRKAQFLQYKNPDGIFQNHTDYLPFYFLTLPDETYILAQIPKSYAKDIQNGKSVTLPIGKKVMKGIPKSLHQLCDQYDADTGCVYYAFCDEWQEKHQTAVFVIRAGVVSVVFFGIAISLILIGNKVFGVKDA